MIRNARKIQLPQNFAQKLLECEIEYKLSDTPSKQMVKSLIQLYSQGVEYYESIRSHKYLYFQMKMNEIFMTASTIQAINDKKAQDADSPLKKKMKSNHEEQKIQALQIKQKQQKMFQEVTENTTEAATVTTVKKMINQNDLKSIETNEKVKKEFQNQDAKLKERLQKRKSRLLFSKSFSGLMPQNDTQDTLFTDASMTELIKMQSTPQIMKPIEVSFNSIIKQNQSDDEEIEKVGRRRMSISQDPSKKARTELQTTLKANYHN